MRAALLLAVAIWVPSATAQTMYKCVDRDKRVTYSNVTCEKQGLINDGVVLDRTSTLPLAPITPVKPAPVAAPAASPATAAPAAAPAAAQAEPPPAPGQRIPPPRSNTVEPRIPPQMPSQALPQAAPRNDPDAIPPLPTVKPPLK